MISLNCCYCLKKRPPPSLSTRQAGKVYVANMINERARYSQLLYEVAKDVFSCVNESGRFQPTSKAF